MLKKLDIRGSPYIGVYCRANENIAIVPRIDKKIKEDLSEALEVEILELDINGSSILGSLVALNSFGAVVTNFASSENIAILKKKLNVLRITDKLNAVGNNILVNDRGAVAHPGICRKTVKLLEEVLNVEVFRGTIAGLKTVGAAAIATNKGVLSHPYTTEKERRKLEEVFKVPVSVGTVNYGTPLIGACVIANTKGACVGSTTTTIELGRLENALGLLE